MKDQRTRQAQKVTWVGFFVNLGLTIFKLIAGFLGKSTAMIADGVHSLSDFVTDIIVIAFIEVSGKERDSDHQYGHGKYETFATMLISMALLIVGIGIFWNGFSKVIDVIHGKTIEQPGILALIAAVISVIAKESIFWYTKKAGEKLESQAVIANAWHHRSDAFSSIGTALGISGAIFLGESWRILDPLAGIIVSFFIIKVAVQLGMPSMHELLERSLPKETVKEIEQIISSDKEIKAFHNLKTRKIGNIFAIDVHIKLDATITFVHSHDIATRLEKNLRSRFGSQTITSIHTEPFRE
ncbi:MAG: cation diffusion facilitator family transporter [Paludibacter sp.]|nr:cation diffusion facilitator family transporter [Paludibacter sp.]